MKNAKKKVSVSDLNQSRERDYERVKLSPQDPTERRAITLMKDCKQIGKLTGKKWDKFESNARVYSPYGLCPTLTTIGGGHRQVKIIVHEKTAKGYAEAEIGDSINISYPTSAARRGRVGKGVAHTLMTNHSNELAVTKSGVRKLTPREYWRLMGFDDEDFDKAKEVSSDTQLYKQAGNSIVVNVLEAVLGQLLGGAE